MILFWDHVLGYTNHAIMIVLFFSFKLWFREPIIIVYHQVMISSDHWLPVKLSPWLIQRGKWWAFLQRTMVPESYDVQCVIASSAAKSDPKVIPFYPSSRDCGSCWISCCDYVVISRQQLLLCIFAVGLFAQPQTTGVGGAHLWLLLLIFPIVGYIPACVDFTPMIHCVFCFCPVKYE